MSVLTATLLCLLAVASSAEGLSALPSFGETREMLRLAALGKAPYTKGAIETLQHLWAVAPSYQREHHNKEFLAWWQKLRQEKWKELHANDNVPQEGEDPEFDAVLYQEHWYDPDRDLQRRIDGSQSAIAKHLMRIFIEEGDVDAVVAVQEQNKPQAASILKGDLLFALGEFDKAIAHYQENMVLAGADPDRHDRRQPFVDDVLFSKIGLALCKLGRLPEAKRSFQCAAELQETHGLYLEFLVSTWRIHALCGGQAPKLLIQETQLLPLESIFATLAPEFSEYYPTVSRMLGGNTQEEDPSVVARAFVAYVRGDYVEARKLFAQASATHKSHSTESTALWALLLRERHLAELANVFEEAEDQDEDHFFFLKKQVLRMNSFDPIAFVVQRMTQRVSEKHLTAFDAAQTRPGLLHSRCQEDGHSNDEVSQEDNEEEPIRAIEAACERSESSSLRAAAYVQASNYLRVLAETNRPDVATTSDSPKPAPESVQALLKADEEDFLRQQRQRRSSLALFEKALSEPGISPLVRIKATVDYATMERSIDKPKRVERSKDGTHVITMQATDEYGNTASPPKPRAAETREKEVLAQAWKELEEMGRSDSLTALEVARRMKRALGGSRERQVLAALFGDTSKPALARRQEEAAEDLRQGSGKRAEELYTQLLADEENEQSKLMLIRSLISAKKKQGKYREAIEVFEKLKKIEEFQTRSHIKGYDLLRLAELHQRNGDLDSAASVYQEVAALKYDRFMGAVSGSSMRAHGWVGIGDIALERGQLKRAQEAFQKGIGLVQAEVDAVFSKDYSLEDDMGREEDMLKNNAIAAIGNCMYEIGEVNLKHGLDEEALGVFEKCMVSVDNEWFGTHRESYKKRVLSIIEEIKDRLAESQTQEGR